MWAQFLGMQRLQVQLMTNWRLTLLSLFASSSLSLFFCFSLSFCINPFVTGHQHSQAGLSPPTLLGAYRSHLATCSTLLLSEAQREAVVRLCWHYMLIETVCKHKISTYGYTYLYFTMNLNFCAWKKKVTVVQKKISVHGFGEITADRVLHKHCIPLANNIENKLSMNSNLTLQS